jgi:hypothetical protein
MDANTRTHMKTNTCTHTHTHNTDKQLPALDHVLLFRQKDSVELDEIGLV